MLWTGTGGPDLVPAKPWTFWDWWKASEGQAALGVSVGYWRELKQWPVPGRIWKWHGWLPELWYYVKCRLWKRYHVVKCRTLHPTYSDPRERLLHVNFAVLEQLIFRERPFDHICTDGDDPNDGKSWAWALKEMRELWEWWTIHRPAREAEYDRRLHAWADFHHRDCDGDITRWQPRNDPPDTRAAWESLKALDEDSTDDEDDAMLHRLVNVRRYMWT